MRTKKGVFTLSVKKVNIFGCKEVKHTVIGTYVCVLTETNKGKITFTYMPEFQTVCESLMNFVRQGKTYEFIVSNANACADSNSVEDNLKVSCTDGVICFLRALTERQLWVSKHRIRIIG